MYLASTKLLFLHFKVAISDIFGERTPNYESIASNKDINQMYQIHYIVYSAKCAYYYIMGVGCWEQPRRLCKTPS